MAEKPGLGSGILKDFDVDRAQARSHPRLSDAVTTSVQALPIVAPQPQQQQGQQRKSIAAHRPPDLHQSRDIRPGVHRHQVHPMYFIGFNAS